MAKCPSSTILRDPIHGSIELNGFLVKIINTPQFQRLRRIKQLSAAFVYPGAVHTRFEHSIGVCHIAAELVKGLNKKHSEEPVKRPNGEQLEQPLIPPKDELCVLIAALCHDLGHGPFSHLHDKVLQEPDEREASETCHWRKHEYRSAEILEELLDDSKFWDLPELPEKFTREDLDFIQGMITFSEDLSMIEKQQDGDCTSADDRRNKGMQETLKRLKKWERSERVFLLEIVANGLTGIDVDKMDYFARDSHGLGLPNRFDWRRYIQVAKVMYVNEESCFRLCTSKKDVTNLYELFHTRAVLYQLAYKHKTTVIIEYMLKNGFKEANKCVKVTVKTAKKDPETSEGEKPQELQLLECWRDMKAFCFLDDSIVDIILKTAPQVSPSGAEGITVTDGDALKEAKKWLERVLKERRLPKFLGVTTSEKGPDEAETFEDSDHFNAAYLIKQKVKVDYGMGETDPLRYQYFYTKDEPNKPLKLNREEVSKLLVPSKFEDKHYFWYYDTHRLKQGDGKSCLKKLRKWIEDKKTPYAEQDNEQSTA